MEDAVFVTPVPVRCPHSRNALFLTVYMYLSTTNEVFIILSCFPLQCVPFNTSFYWIS